MNRKLFLSVFTLVMSLSVGALAGDDDIKELKKLYPTEIASCKNREGYIYKASKDGKVPKDALTATYNVKEYPATEALFLLQYEDGQVGGKIQIKSDKKGFEYGVEYHDGEKATVKVKKGAVDIIIDPDVAFEEGGYLTFDCEVKIPKIKKGEEKEPSTGDSYLDGKIAEAKALKKLYPIKIATCENRQGPLFSNLDSTNDIREGRTTATYSVTEYPATKALLVIESKADKGGGRVPLVTEVVDITTDDKGFEHVMKYQSGDEKKVRIEKGKPADILLFTDIPPASGGYLTYDCKVKIPKKK